MLLIYSGVYVDTRFPSGTCQGERRKNYSQLQKSAQRLTKEASAHTGYTQLECNLSEMNLIRAASSTPSSPALGGPSRRERIAKAEPVGALCATRPNRAFAAMGEQTMTFFVF